MASKIQLRRDTAANWSSTNPILASGEIGFITDTNKFKIGNGSTAFNSLSFFNGNLTGSVLDDLSDVTITSAANGDFLRWNGTAWINDAVNLSTDTVGDYVASLVAGTGITLSNNSGEAAAPTINVDTSIIQARVTNVTDTEIGYLDGVTSLIQGQIDSKSSSTISINAQAASYTLVLSDKDKLVEIDNGSANNLTIPLNSSVEFPVGTQISILQTGAGTTTLVPTSGVTLNATPGLILRARWSSVTLIKRATNTWVAIGDLRA
jgi:hypothetical protein